MHLLAWSMFELGCDFMEIHTYRDWQIWVERCGEHGHKASVQNPGTDKWICVAYWPEIGSGKQVLAKAKEVIDEAISRGA
jgi:hypothetical protein